MKITYCSGGLVKISHDGADYDLPNSYDLIQSRIGVFNKFGIDSDKAEHAAIVLTLQQAVPEFCLSADDLAVVNQVSQLVTAEIYL